MQHSSAFIARSKEPTDYDEIGAARPARPLTLREQLLWTLFSAALLICFLALLIEDQIA